MQWFVGNGIRYIIFKLLLPDGCLPAEKEGFLCGYEALKHDKNKLCSLLYLKCIKKGNLNCTEEKYIINNV